MMDYKKFTAGLRSAAGSYALFYGAPRGDLEKAADVIEELAARLEPSSEPFPLEELRGMDGEPVWIVPMRGSGGFCTWMLVDAEYELCREAHGEMAVFENCGKTWLAYRRRLEDGKT